MKKIIMAMHLLFATFQLFSMDLTQGGHNKHRDKLKRSFDQCVSDHERSQLAAQSHTRIAQNEDVLKGLRAVSTIVPACSGKHASKLQRGLTKCQADNHRAIEAVRGHIAVEKRYLDDLLNGDV